MFKKTQFIIIQVNKKVLLLSIFFLLFFIFFTSSKNVNFPYIETFHYGKIVAIDPGHGGIDGGTHDQKGLLEKDINLEIALYLKDYLEDKGFHIIMTRDSDVSLEDKSNIKSSRYRRDLHARKEIINRNHASVFVSVHVNASLNSPHYRGAMVFYYPNSKEGESIATLIGKSIDQIIYEDYLNLSSIHTKILSRNYYILRETKVPGALVEVGFITNPDDWKLLQDDEYKKRMAFAIGRGIISYLTQSN